MNIAFIVSSLSYGGAEKQAITDANLLSAKHKVYLITFKDGAQKEVINNNVNYVLLKKNNYIITSKILAEFCKQYKIEVIHTSLFAPSIISAIASLISDFKVVWHFHSHEYDAPCFSKLALIIASRFPSLKKIYFVNTELKEYLTKRFLLLKNKTGILYNSTGITNNIKKIQQKNSKVIIGYVGRIVSLKRIQYLIELAEFLLNKGIDQFEIWIIGDGKQKENLEKNVRGKKITKWVKFLGFQKNPHKYYRHFNIFALPSREECLSIALIDAGIMGIPSIAFNVGGNNEIIENDKSGYIVENKSEFFKRSKDLIIDEYKREKMAEFAKKICSNKFSIKARRNNLIEISKNVLKI